MQKKELYLFLISNFVYQIKTKIKVDRKLLLAALKEKFGFEKFKEGQEEIVQNVLEGRDTFVVMPTGGGKSLCYQLPALMKEGTAVVISPLIALMKNQVDAMRNFSETDHVAHFLNSSLSPQEARAVRQDILAGKTKLLYFAPEALSSKENIELLKQIKISFYAVDEAHCISEWGHDFRPEYRRIRPLTNEIQPAPIIALTASATPKVQNDIQKNLGMKNVSIFKFSFNRPNLYYEVRPKTANIDREIIKFIRAHEGKSGIIYCLSRKKVEELAELLQLNGISALPYHAGMESALRSQNQNAFLMEKVNVIVATIAFGMGIDKPDVRFVIHYDMPKSLEGYYQETGRVGRDGGEGLCITFYSQKDVEKLEKFTEKKLVAEQEINKHLISETMAYAESSVCRRKLILHYFGEEYAEENCGNCDNCLNPKKKIDATELLTTVLEAIVSTKEKHKTDVIIDFLCGKESKDVKYYILQDLELFGTVSDEEKPLLSAVIRQAMLAGLLFKDIETYGVLKISPAGQEFLKNPTEFLITENNEFDDEDDDTPVLRSGAGGALDPELFAILKDERKRLAKSLDIPPFVIFQDPSLEAMATTYPITIEELQNIPGVGQGKAKRYGEEFLALIKRHVQENEIERPEDLRVRSVANKSALKYAIITAIDRKVSLDVLAERELIDFADLLSEIEAIVYSGTKLNIDYYLKEIMDEEIIEEIFDYFQHEAKTDSIEEAMQKLGEDDFTEEEVRLVKIKFFSELGN